MQYWTGSAWSVVQRVFVGEAVTGASSVNSVVTYAYRGRFASIWTSVVANTIYTISHNLGMPAVAANAAISLFASATGVDTDSAMAQQAVPISGSFYGYTWSYATTPRSAIAFNTKDYVLISSAPAWVPVGFYKLFAARGW